MLFCTHCHDNLPDPPGPWCERCNGEEPARGWPDDPLLGRVVAGRYRLERRLGAGGMGVVYRAVDPHGRRFAVKTLHAHYSASEDMARRFRREARCAAQLRGPHAVRVHDAGELRNGTLFFAMDLVEGESLTQRIARRGALPPGEAVLLFAQLADALSEAHGLDIVHRDIKPDNLLIVASPAGGSEVLKVLDFGIAKVLDARLGTVGQTVTGQVFGTPEFMSPEQVRGATDVDHRTDVYSAGLCLFFMLTGKLPFMGRTPGESMVLRMHQAPPRLSECRPDRVFPMGLEAVLARLLARRACDRYASLDEARRDLEDVVPPAVAEAGDTVPMAGLPPPAVPGDSLPPPPVLASAPVDAVALRGRWAMVAASFFAVMSAVAWLLAR